MDQERLALLDPDAADVSSPIEHGESTGLLPNPTSYTGPHESAPIYLDNTVPFPVPGEQEYYEGNGGYGFHHQYMAQQHVVPPPPDPGIHVPYPMPAAYGEDQLPYGAGNQGYVLEQYMPQLPPPPDPGMPQTAAVVQPRPMKEHYYALSVVLSVIWCLMCAPYLLCCTISAACYARDSKRAARDGDMEAARKNAQHALHCNIASIVCGVIAYIGLVVIIPVFVTIIGLGVTANH